jgi:hypothetical protein
MHGSMQKLCWHGRSFGFLYRSRHIAQVSSCSNCSMPVKGKENRAYSQSCSLRARIDIAKWDMHIRIRFFDVI